MVEALIIFGIVLGVCSGIRDSNRTRVKENEKPAPVESKGLSLGDLVLCWIGWKIFGGSGDS